MTITATAAPAKSLLTPGDHTLILIDHQSQMAFATKSIDTVALRTNGHPNKQVAWRLQVSTDTVKAHLKNIFAKLDVSDRTQAVIIAARRGYIDI